MSELYDAVLSRRSLVKGSIVAGAVATLPFSLTRVAAQDKIVATMVTDTAGLGDQNFNDLAFKGGTEAAAEFGIDWKAIESADQAAYEPNLTQAAEQGQLTVATGFKLTDAIDRSRRALSGQVLRSSSTRLCDAGNVRSALFEEDQIGYLCGVVVGPLDQDQQTRHRRWRAHSTGDSLRSRLRGRRQIGQRGRRSDHQLCRRFQ